MFCPAVSQPDLITWTVIGPHGSILYSTAPLWPVVAGRSITELLARQLAITYAPSIGSAHCPSSASSLTITVRSHVDSSGGGGGTVSGPSVPCGSPSGCPCSAPAKDAMPTKTAMQAAPNPILLARRMMRCVLVRCRIANQSIPRGACRAGCLACHHQPIEDLLDEES